MHDWTDSFMKQLKLSYPRYEIANPNGVDDYIAVNKIMDAILMLSEKGNA